MSIKNMSYNQMEEETVNSLIVEMYDDPRAKPKTVHEKRKFSKLEMRK